VFVLSLAERKTRDAAKKTTTKVTDMAEDTGNAVAGGKNCFF